MAITVITVVTGWYAYNTVAHDEPSHLAMTDHRNWALATAGLFLFATVWSILRYRVGKEASALLLALLLVAITALGGTAWRGGEVVYSYGLGVMSLPNRDEHEHKVGEVEYAHGSVYVVDDHHNQKDEMPSEPSEEFFNTKQNSTEPVQHEHGFPHNH